MSKIRAIIMGAPGSGKGTISDRIQKHFVISHISSGDILRANIAAGTDLGKTANTYVSVGKLVPDNVMNDLMHSEIEKVKEPWLLDGYPRTRAQAETLCGSVDINLALDLVVPFDVIIDRLKSRWIHLASGRIYNIGFNDPKVPGLDDVTGEKLIQREDDKPEAVKQRLETYKKTADPVIEYFKSKGVLESFHGNTSNEIWEKVLPFLRTKLIPK